MGRAPIESPTGHRCILGTTWSPKTGQALGTSARARTGLPVP